MNNTIREIRLKRGLSQEDMARDLDVSSNYISLIETDRKKPGMNFLRRISTQYKIPLILLAKDFLIPEGKTKKEKEIREKILELFNDLESISNHETGREA